jgi:hypothetical protein|tara:strand:+ start:6446 stop:7243 length:798 start_codon:yes stop_codon:yes gene_type:complete
METKEKKKPVVKAPATPEVKKDTWEYKDRQYYLANGKEPITYTIPSKHSRKYPLVWFDKDLGYEREMRYATNQKSIFVDKQEGNVTLSHIVFENGHLHVPKTKRSLQEFLMHHPHNGFVFKELDKKEEAIDELSFLDIQVDALNAARDMDIDQGEAILRVEVGSKVSKLSTKELKRDLMIFAKQNPELFLNLSQDENVVLRNFAINATENNIINLSPDQKTFSWASNGRKLMTVPFDENPYSAMASWFKTDEGLDVYKSIDKKIN